MSKLALIAPTKSRPDGFKKLLDSHVANSTSNTDLIPVVDHEEIELYKQPDNMIAANGGLVTKLNTAARRIAHKYGYLGFIADDVVIKTPEHDRIITEAFTKNPHIHIVYCEDELHHGAIANHWVIRSSTYEKIGFFCPPQLKHMFIDNFWTTLGRETDSIMYLSDVVWQHNHYVTGRSENDEVYKSSQVGFKEDEIAYKKLITSEHYGSIQDILRVNAG